MNYITILTHTQIEHKIRRIALQILESNSTADKIILAGIAQNGYIIAEKLKNVIAEYASIEIILCKVIINKKELHQPINLNITEAVYKNESVVLIDDVLNSGGTLIYGAKHFLNTPLKQLKTAVLINRNHKKYPIKADFKGISLSTSIHEHIEVSFSNNTATAVLI